MATNNNADGQSMKRLKTKKLDVDQQQQVSIKESLMKKPRAPGTSDRQQLSFKDNGMSKRARVPGQLLTEQPQLSISEGPNEGMSRRGKVSKKEGEPLSECGNVGSRRGKPDRSLNEPVSKRGGLFKNKKSKFQVSSMEQSCLSSKGSKNDVLSPSIRGGKKTSKSKRKRSNDTDEKGGKRRKKKGPLEIGGTIEGTGGTSYQVRQLIRNPGSNGEYLVSDGSTEKILRLNLKGKFKLKHTMDILKKVGGMNQPNGKCFFIEFKELGSYLKYDYLVTSVYNIQLYEVHTALFKVFSRDCTMNIAYQTLECLRALHNAGYILRNVKPTSFSIGFGQNERLICLSDFRISRKHIEDYKVINARPRVEYIGTARYSSINSMKCIDQGRKDDLESWLYMIIDLLDYTSALPWKNKPKIEVLPLKEKFFCHGDPSVYVYAPEGFKKIVDLINQWKYDTLPDYVNIISILDEICSQNSLDRTVCDWIGKFPNFSTTQKAIDDAANKTSDNICSGVDDFEYGPPKKQTKVPRKLMNPGDTIKNGQFTWKVVNVLGSGGFGDVYRVYNETDKKKKNYALKTESEDGRKNMLRLKVEMQVLMAIQEDRKAKGEDKDKQKTNKHFVEFVDRGKSEELRCKFIVMSIVGPSLDDCRKKFNVDLSQKATPYIIAVQTLESVRDLHNLGFLHRDIKPANFAVGIGPNEYMVYMLDFGISRLFIDQKTKALRAPRKKVKFLGTLRFASRACMKWEDQGRKDDLECWMYMIFDLLDEDNGIAWKCMVDRDKIVTLKTAFFQTSLPTVYEIIPRQMKTLVKYIDTLEFQSVPDYVYIENQLTNVAESIGHSIKNRKKVEWLGKLKKDESEQTKRIDDESESESESKKSNDSE
ncbi:unnamed protein product [Caenorhabditis angaria]|uniref:Protein kinase domain-containing protein n=1 Tax=Caenorhabditis angaria TaxID=860376 RepID=A0A9P1MSP1_9PELO|nr:unnamed protein product [Caenorhabditis angaria]